MIHRRSVLVPMQPRAVPARGFTLIELMVAVMILAILITLTVPSFNNAALSGKLGGFANDLVASAQLARSEAIKRNATVMLCASSDGASCDAPDGWETGWIVIVDPGGADERLLQAHPALPDEFRVIETIAGATEIDFLPTVIGGGSAEFQVCRAEPEGSQERRVEISVSRSTRVLSHAPPLDDCPD